MLTCLFPLSNIHHYFCTANLAQSLLIINLGDSQNEYLWKILEKSLSTQVRLESTCFKEKSQQFWFLGTGKISIMGPEREHQRRKPQRGWHVKQLLSSLIKENAWECLGFIPLPCTNLLPLTRTFFFCWYSCYSLYFKGQYKPHTFSDAKFY